jgi:hypothetical protein
MRRFTVCLLMVLVLSGCSLTRGQQSRAPFASGDWSAAAERSESEPAPARPERESFFKRVFFGGSNGR